jgi:hypothetical protein
MALAVAPGTALAAKSCGKVHGRYVDKSGRRHHGFTARVQVLKGQVACRTARNVARAVFDGRARFHDNGFTYNSYMKFGRWKGDYRMNYWVMTNTRSHVQVGGPASYPY